MIFFIFQNMLCMILNKIETKNEKWVILSTETDWNAAVIDSCHPKLIA